MTKRTWRDGRHGRGSSKFYIRVTEKRPEVRRRKRRGVYFRISNTRQRVSPSPSPLLSSPLLFVLSLIWKAKRGPPTPPSSPSPSPPIPPHPMTPTSHPSDPPITHPLRFNRCRPTMTPNNRPSPPVVSPRISSKKLLSRQDPPLSLFSLLVCDMCIIGFK